MVGPCVACKIEEDEPWSVSQNLFCESEMALFMAPTEKCYQKVLDTRQRR